MMTTSPVTVYLYICASNEMMKHVGEGWRSEMDQQLEILELFGFLVHQLNHNYTEWCKSIMTSLCTVVCAV